MMMIVDRKEAALWIRHRTAMDTTLRWIQAIVVVVLVVAVVVEGVIEGVVRKFLTWEDGTNVSAATSSSYYSCVLLLFFFLSFRLPYCRALLKETPRLALRRFCYCRRGGRRTRLRAEMFHLFHGSRLNEGWLVIGRSLTTPKSASASAAEDTPKSPCGCRLCCFCAGIWSLPLHLARSLANNNNNNSFTPSPDVAFIGRTSHVLTTFGKGDVLHSFFSFRSRQQIHLPSPLRPAPWRRFCINVNYHIHSWRIYATVDRPAICVRMVFFRDSSRCLRCCRNITQHRRGVYANQIKSRTKKKNQPQPRRIRHEHPYRPEHICWIKSTKKNRRHYAANSTTQIGNWN